MRPACAEGHHGDVLGLTRQFATCGNPFRLDSYKGCAFDCLYCFANNRAGAQSAPGLRPGDVGVLRRNLRLAFEADRRVNGLTVELLKRSVPLHMGGMSDPGQPRALPVTREFLRELGHWAYPVQISTKGIGWFSAGMSRTELDPARVAFQVSLSTMDARLAAMIEPGAPSPVERLAFVVEAKQRGFWCGVRVQPLVDLKEALAVLEAVDKVADFIGLEHLSVPMGGRGSKRLLEYLGLDTLDFVNHAPYLRFPLEQREANVLEVLAHTSIDVGVGDVELQSYSTTDNCCGLDTMGPAFDHWMRYNQLALIHTADRQVWTPKASVREVINSARRKPGLRTVREYVDDWLES